MDKFKLPHGKTKHLLVKLTQIKTGKSTVALAKELGLSYHILIKYLEKLPGRENAIIRARIAARLDIPYEQLWGPESEKHIRKIISSEIRRYTIAHALESQEKILERALG